MQKPIYLRQILNRDMLHAVSLSLDNSGCYTEFWCNRIDLRIQGLPGGEYHYRNDEKQDQDIAFVVGVDRDMIENSKLEEYYCCKVRFCRNVSLSISLVMSKHIT